MPYYQNMPNPPHDPKPDKGIPLWIIITLFFVNPVLAAALLALRLMINGDLPFHKTGSRSSQPYRSNPYQAAPGASFQGAPAGAPQPSTVSGRTGRRPTQPKAPQKAAQAKSLGRAQELLAWAGIIAGILLCVSGAAQLAESLNWLLMGIFELSYDLLPTISALLTVVGGAALAGYSFSVRKLVQLRRTLKKAIGKRKFIPLSELAEILSCSRKKAVDAAEAAARAGDLGPDAYVDHRADMLVVEGTAPEPAKEEPPAPKAQPAEPEYRAILQQLRAANDAIPGEEMSAKIDRLEDISAKIFDLAEKDPDKLPQLRKFLNYYLPTSLKLLNTYAQLDAQGVEGDNITQSKKQIESTMDTLCDAFANQLDKLFTSDAIDVSTDIAAMQAMLHQDGLADSGLPTLEL